MYNISQMINVATNQFTTLVENVAVLNCIATLGKFFAGGKLHKDIFLPGYFLFCHGPLLQCCPYCPYQILVD
jgi:hypothetical protein